MTDYGRLLTFFFQFELISILQLRILCHFKSFQHHLVAKRSSPNVRNRWTIFRFDIFFPVSQENIHPAPDIQTQKGFSSHLSLSPPLDTLAQIMLTHPPPCAHIHTSRIVSMGGGGSLWRHRLTMTQVTLRRKVMGMEGLMKASRGLTTPKPIT